MLSVNLQLLALCTYIFSYIKHLMMLRGITAETCSVFKQNKRNIHHNSVRRQSSFNLIVVTDLQWRC